MIWTLKKISEDDKVINIGYSYEKNHSCDGLIVYDKKANTMKLVKVSPVPGEDEEFAKFAGKRAFQFAFSLMYKNMLTEKPYTVVTG